MENSKERSMTLETSLSDYTTAFDYDDMLCYRGKFDPSIKYKCGDIIIDEHGVISVCVDAAGLQFEPLTADACDPEKPHKLEPVSCPHCGGTIKYDERTHTARCEYCNTLFT